LAITSPEHSLRDLVDLGRGLQVSARRLFSEYLAFDAARLGLEFDVPFFVFQGAADVHTLANFRGPLC
jgi:hypothetical protein